MIELTDTTGRTWIVRMTPAAGRRCTLAGVWLPSPGSRENLITTLWACVLVEANIRRVSKADLAGLFDEENLRKFAEFLPMLVHEMDRARESPDCWETMSPAEQFVALMEDEGSYLEIVENQDFVGSDNDPFFTLNIE